MRSVCAVSLGEAGFSRSRAGGGSTSTVEVAATAKSVVEAWPLGIAEHSATSIRGVTRCCWIILGPEQVAPKAHE